MAREGTASRTGAAPADNSDLPTFNGPALPADEPAIGGTTPLLGSAGSLTARANPIDTMVRPMSSVTTATRLMASTPCSSKRLAELLR
jgi:hypothetical protein